MVLISVGLNKLYAVKLYSYDKYVNTDGPFKDFSHTLYWIVVCMH
jgi:hypothetical protein